MGARPGVRRRRLACAFALATLVHAGLLAAPWCEAPVRAPVRRVRLARLVPPEPDEPPVPAPLKEPTPPPTAANPAPQPPGPRAPAGEPAPATPALEGAVSEPALRAQPETQRTQTIDLFPEEAIGRAAAPRPPEQLTDEQLFARRMARWTDDFHAHQRVDSGQTPRQVRALGERMWSWYLPDESALARRAPAGLGAGSSIVPLIEYYTSGRANKPSDAMANVFGDRRHIDPTGRLDLRLDLPFMACFGHCSDVGHEVARLETTVVIHHDERGLPDEWSIADSSGDADFDGEALSAVRVAVERTDVAELLGGQPPARRTDWVFRVTAYRWSRTELSDPLFIPPGRELEAYSDRSGKTTMVREVRLVALRLAEG